jgi:hypothetical protein
MNCYACEQAASHQCSRCSKSYCLAHGDDAQAGGQGLCADCLNPLNAAPSSAVYRTSLFALLIASVVALWLLIRPPDLPGEAETVRPQPTSNENPEPTDPAVGPTDTAPAQETPAPQDATPTEAAETPAPEVTEYTVVDGDTWFGIAEAFGVDAEDLAAVNGLTLDDFIQPGDVLVIP